MAAMGNHIWRSRRLTVLLAVMDAVALGLLWLLAWRIRYFCNRWASAPINPISNYIQTLPGLLAGWLFVLAIFGHYAHRERISSLNQLSRVFKAALWCLWITIIFSYIFFRRQELGRSIALGSAVFIAGYLYASRTALRVLKTRALGHGEGARPILIVGAVALGRRVAEHLSAHPEIGYRVLGFVATGSEQEANGKAAPVVGTIADLPRLIAEQGAEEVFFADPTLAGDRILNLVVECEQTGVQFKIVSDDFFRVLSGDAAAAFLLNPTRIEHVRAVAEAGLTMPRKSTYFFPKVISGLVFNPLR